MNIPTGAPQNPWRLLLEPVFGCNRRCWHCAHANEKNRGVSVKDATLIDPLMVKDLFHQLDNWLPKIRVEINHRGEPTLHPQIFEIIRHIRTEMPRAHIMLQTNTELWFEDSKQWVNEFYYNGGNLLVLNAYKPGLYEQWLEKLGNGQYGKWSDYYLDRKCPSIYNYYPPSNKLIVLCNDLGTMALSTDKRRMLNNIAGNTDPKIMEEHGIYPLDEPLRQKCTAPFREIIVNSNGHVPICCLDWEEKCLLGDLNKESIRQIWDGQRRQAARYLLNNKDGRVMQPCTACSQMANRPGFLPKMGEAPGTIEELARFLQPEYK